MPESGNNAGEVTAWSADDPNNRLQVGSWEDVRVITERLASIENAMARHVGQDWAAAGYDYPHPSMKVSTVRFGEENGMLYQYGLRLRTLGPTGLENFGFIEWIVADQFDLEGNSVTTDNFEPYGRIGTETDTGQATMSIEAAGDLLGNTAMLELRGSTGITTVRMVAANGPEFRIAETDAGVLSQHGRLISGGGGGVGLLLEEFAGAPVGYTTDGFLWVQNNILYARLGGVDVQVAPLTAFNDWPLATKAVDYTLTTADGVILVDASGAARTMTLPTAVGNTGLQFIIKKIDTSANTVTIDGNAAETIDGLATWILYNQNQSITIVSDGTNWEVVDQPKDGYVSKSANYTASLYDSVIAVDASGAARTITLPAAAGNAGLQYTIKKTDTSANAVTIDANAAETIEGSATWLLYSPQQSVTIVCDGTNWRVVNRLGLGYVVKTANYTLTVYDDVVEVTTSSVTLTLPDAATVAGKEYLIYVSFAAINVIVTGTGGDPIGTRTNYTLVNYGYLRTISNGTVWMFFGSGHHGL